MTYDYIVLGLGAIGSATAYQLAKRGQRVLGIDQFAPPHVHGSTHGETRITRLAIGEGEEFTPLAVRSHEIWRDVERETGRSVLTTCGGLILSSPRKTATCHVDTFFQNTLAAASRYGIDHRVLTAREVRQQFPAFAMPDDIVGYYEPGAGFLRPEVCVMANLELAGAHGAELHTNEKVLEFRRSSDGGVEVVTTRATYSAGRLLITAGPWLPQVLGEPSHSYFSVTRQVLYWFEIRSNVDRFYPDVFPVFICELEGQKNVVYGFPAIDGPSGGVKIATEQFDVGTTPDDVDRAVHPDEIEAMYRQCVEPYFTDIGSRCIKATTCLYTSTHDCRFVIQPHAQIPEAMIVSPCSGHGFKHSAALGEALAQLVIAGHSQVDISAFTMQPRDTGEA